MEDVTAIAYLGVLVMNLSIYEQQALKWRILFVCIEVGEVTDCEGVYVFADIVVIVAEHILCRRR
jgi:hypothetical protein